MYSSKNTRSSDGVSRMVPREYGNASAHAPVSAESRWSCSKSSRSAAYAWWLSSSMTCRISAL